MAEHATLLAYLVPRLNNRVEDAATDALAFILNKSAACRGALDHLLRDGDFNPEPIARVKTQATYQDGSRPDMTGYDRCGTKRLLIEAKFWASLGQRQAGGYFEQLQEAGPGALLFIAPDRRIETLWAEIIRQMENVGENVQLELIEPTGRTRKAKIVNSGKRVMLVSWDQLLGGMATAVADDGRVASDIQQLRGLAKYQDEEAFQPIHPEEFGLAFPRRIRGLNKLIDATVARGINGRWMTTRSLNKAPQREGYGRYFRFVDDAIKERSFLGVDYDRWATRGDTPLWLWIGSRGHQVSGNAAKLRNGMPSLVEHERAIAGKTFTGIQAPIYLKTGVEYERVLDDVVRQVMEIRDVIREP